MTLTPAELSVLGLVVEEPRHGYDLERVIDVVAERALEHNLDLPESERLQLQRRVRERSNDLLDEWSNLANELSRVGSVLQYQSEVGGSPPLLREFLDPEVKNLPPRHRNMKFRANRSMRDVEPSVNLWVANLEGIEIEEDEA